MELYAVSLEVRTTPSAASRACASVLDAPDRGTAIRRTASALRRKSGCATRLEACGS